MDTNDRSLQDTEALASLQTVMELQVQGMTAFQATQLAARDALKAKDWSALDRALRSLDFQSEGLRCLEERRHGLWSSIQVRYLGREGRFYETVPRLPEAYREPLTRLHRELKAQTLGLRALSQGLAAYVQTAGALIQAVVQEIQPDLKGRLYSRSGRIRGGEAQPLVLNAHF
jgi:hypothetical protein